MYLLRTLVSIFHLIKHDFTSGELMSHHRIHLLSFQHAVATPITILSASLENLESYDAKERKKVLRKSRTALATIQKLSKEFVESNKFVYKSNVVMILKEIATLLEDEGKVIHILGVEQLSNFNIYKINEARLKEAFVCIINNGLEACTSKNKAVAIVCHATKTQISISIRDFGGGVSNLKKLLIQLPLVSFKENGSGLGITYARRVMCHELKGSLQLISVPENGTIVECSIPKRR